MTKAGADNWKTPLGYYERAIAELTKTRSEIQAELQNLKKMQTDLVELQNLKAEFQSSQIELQAIKAELQTTKECLATTQQTASSAQARVATVEKAAHDAHTELQELKHFMTNQLPANNAQVSDVLPAHDYMDEASNFTIRNLLLHRPSLQIPQWFPNTDVSTLKFHRAPDYPLVTSHREFVQVPKSMYNQNVIDFTHPTYEPS